MSIMFNHAIWINSVSCHAYRLFFKMCKYMHTSCIEPYEEWLVGFCRTRYKVFCCNKDFLIDSFHTFLSQRPRIFTRLLSPFSETRHIGFVVGVGCYTFEYTTRRDFVGHFTCAIMRCDIVTIDHLAIDRVEAVGLP